MKHTIEIKQNPASYKVGMNEVVGLEQAIRNAFQPIQEELKKHVYWDEVDMEPVEYTGRDGFTPYSHNHGGLAIDLILPECESYDFSYIEFGERDCTENGCDENECTCDSDGELDARLRIWFKFEGINEAGELEFYIDMSGGNHDAPYFRNTPTIFECSFTCKSVQGLKRAAVKHIKALLNVMGA